MSNKLLKNGSLINQKMRGKSLKWAMMVLAAGVVGYLILVGVGAVLIVADPIQRVDAVVVLSGGDGDRLALAIEMHANGIAPKLVITDTGRAANALLRREAKAGGFKSNQIYITELTVESTVDEAEAVLALAQEQGWTKLMVVTDPYHSLRTRVIFRDYFRNSGIEIMVQTIVGHWFRSPTWFLRAEGWQFVVLEYSKLAAYFLGFK